jgi:Fe2+ transport system protein FeoA
VETVAAEASRRETPFRPLSELPPGTVAIVESVHGERDLRRRLLEMGFCNRTMVTVIRRAPLGDPIEFLLRGYYVSLRREEARCVLVSAIPSASREERANPSGLRLWK